MGKGAVRRPSFLSTGPTAVRAFFFSLPSGLSSLCRRRADLLRGRIPGRAPLRLLFPCASLSPVSVHPSISCLCAHFSLHVMRLSVQLPFCVEPTAGCTSCRLSVQLLFRVESMTDRTSRRLSVLSLFRVEPMTDCTSRRLSVQLLFRVEPMTDRTSRRPAIRGMNGHTPSGSRQLSIQPFVLFRNCF